MLLVTFLAVLLAAATPHIQMATSASAPDARAGATLRLFVDVIPDAKVHVYAPGAKDYQPITLVLEPRPGIKVGKLAYPKSQDWYFEPLKEHVPVFQLPFRLEQTVTLGASLKTGDKVTVAGVLNYQACNDVVCFNPVSAPVSWTVTVK
jgi:Thiol:disulfide interchange protein DsbD, N-terminal